MSPGQDPLRHRAELAIQHLISQVTLDGREAQPAPDLRLDVDADRGRFAPDSIGRAMLVTSCGRVARPFCGVNDAIAPAAPHGITWSAWTSLCHRRVRFALVMLP
jgi:hypothetical protein